MRLLINLCQKLFSNSMFHIIIIDILLYFIFFQFVGYYYSVGLPYYDSVGAYIHMFSTANTTRQLGILEGIKQASGNSLSWWQSFFAVFSARVIPNSPEWMLSLNFITLFIAQITIFQCLVTAGFSKFKSYILTTIVLIPASTIGWVGGLLDMRRDSTFLSLLVADYFLLQNYLWKPKLVKGILVGVLLGFTQWSRGNALPYTFCIIFPALFFYIYKKVLYGRKRLTSLKISVLPFFFFIIISLPFYFFAWRDIYIKYVFGSWALGADRVLALWSLVKFVTVLIFGSPRDVFSITIFFVISINIIIIFSLLRRMLIINTNWYSSNTAIDLVRNSFFIVILISFFNSIILGVGSNGYIFPHFPILVGIFGIVIYICGGLRINYDNKKNNLFRVSITMCWILILFSFNVLRIYMTIPSEQKKLVEQTKKAVVDLGPILGGKNVAYLWLDHVNVYDLNFYITQKGNAPIVAGSGLSVNADTEMPPNLKKSKEQQIDEYIRGVKNKEYIVVTDNLDLYENPSGFFFILTSGRKVIESLLQDPNIIKVYSFNDGSKSYSVLQNKVFKRI